MKNSLKFAVNTFDYPRPLTIDPLIKFRTSIDNVESRLASYSYRNSVQGKVNLHNVYLDLKFRLDQGDSVKSLPLSIRRYLHLIFCLEFSGYRLYKDEKIANEIFEYVEETGDDRLCRKLIIAMLKNYDFQDSNFFVYLHILKTVLTRSLKPASKILIQKDLKYKILSPEGPDVIISYFVSTESDSTTFRQQVGVSGDLARIGLGLHLIDKFSEKMRKNISANNYTELHKYFSFITMSGKLVSSDRAGLIAKTLLEPFVSLDPPDVFKAQIMTFFDTYFGDPRARNDLWLRIDQNLKLIIMRWKVGLTLKAFFGIIESAAKTDKDADRMWKFRKIFWNSYLEEKYITEAWVLLGTIAHSNRKSYLEDNILYGRVKGGQPNHSAILMKIGSLTICEWSHNGALRVWEDGNPNAPKLYKDQYLKDELIRGADVDISHVGSEVSRWQDTIAGEIFDLTRIRVDKWKYFKR